MRQGRHLIRLGARTFSVCGPGDSPRRGSCYREGEIVGYENGRWGRQVLIRWEGEKVLDGSYIHSLMDPRSDKGIGVYVEPQATESTDGKHGA